MNKSIKFYIRVLKPLFAKLPVDLVYLYGSVAFGKNDKLSDIDFGFLFSRQMPEKKRFELRLKLFGIIAKKFGLNEDEIDVVDLLDVSILLQFNAISGKLIYCVDDNKRVDFESYVMSRYHDEHYYLDRYLSETINKLKKRNYFERTITYP